MVHIFLCILYEYSKNTYNNHTFRKFWVKKHLKYRSGLRLVIHGSLVRIDTICPVFFGCSGKGKTFDVSEQNLLLRSRITLIHQSPYIGGSKGRLLPDITKHYRVTICLSEARPVSHIADHGIWIYSRDISKGRDSIFPGVSQMTYEIDAWTGEKGRECERRFTYLENLRA